MRFTTDELAELTGGRVHGTAAEIEGATQDSRAVEPGQLFVPLLAERDGHDYIDAALAAGASAYLTARPPSSGTAIVVDDTYEALRSIARGARQRMSGHVIGITGSVGKTSTRDLLVSILSKSSRAHASRRSFKHFLRIPVKGFSRVSGLTADLNQFN